MPTVTELFEFLARQEACSIERHEIASATFGTLRRALRSIVVSLREGGEDDARVISDTLRLRLSEWLTVPVRFDAQILGVLDCFGEPDAVQGRWGGFIAEAYTAAREAARVLPLSENPIRSEVRDVIRALRKDGHSFKIYCHRRARLHFESIVAEPEDSPLGEVAFLHTVRDYRESAPFHTLLKVGPLRSRGWGAVPDALRTAPRFSNLAQVVWSGCADEPDFGYDPVSTPTNSAGSPGEGASRDEHTGGSKTSWTLRITRSGDEPGMIVENGSNADELAIFQEMNRGKDDRPATLVQIDDECGILYPPHAQVLSFDPSLSAKEPLQPRLPGETLRMGMFVVRLTLAEADLGGLQAQPGYYSRIWKQRLAEEYQRDPIGLALRLGRLGLRLQALHGAIEHWCASPTTVIHAPQKMEHFEMLIRVLGIGVQEDPSLGPRCQHWWQSAWNEIRHSRGDAIQAGVIGHELAEEQVCIILKKLLPEVQRLARAAEVFAIHIPSGEQLRGVACFNKVLSIEEGFRVPDAALKTVQELNTIEQWRA